MANKRQRQRSRSRQENEPQTSDSEVTPNTTHQQLDERQGKRMVGLTAEQIQALLGGARQKGQYLKLLNEFCESGESGVDVQETWMELRDKVASTIKQGFDSAKEKKDVHADAEFVKVIVNTVGEGDNAVKHVYLINMKAAGLAEQEAA